MDFEVSNRSEYYKVSPELIKITIQCSDDTTIDKFIDKIAALDKIFKIPSTFDPIIDESVPIKITDYQIQKANRLLEEFKNLFFLYTLSQ